MNMFVLWRPVFIISLFVTVLWREFNCAKIPQGEANKSANRWGNLRAEGGVVPTSVLHLPIARVHIKYTSSHGFAVYFVVITVCRLSSLAL
jgi:hypothetical protein